MRRDPAHTAFDALLRRHRFAEPVRLMRPSLPPREAFQQRLGRIWETDWLTNDGELVRELEAKLAAYLGVAHVSLTCNGTLALLLALQASDIRGGEVITTPFTFPATVHALHWNRVEPVFCDIDPETFNLDPERVEERVGPETRAILPVHVFGRPCDLDAMEAIGRRHGIPVIYDAAHAMGVRVAERALSGFGDVAVLSFHATKPFTTGEGGAVVCGSEEQRRRIDSLRNFGIADEETVLEPGINAKMSELQAALGLLQLERLEEEIAARSLLTGRYRERLAAIPGIRLLPAADGVRHNHAYLPVLVDDDAYGLPRDVLYDRLKQFNVFARKYFHPLCSQHECYAHLPSAAPGKLPHAEAIARRILCLPLYAKLGVEAVDSICDVIAELPECL